MDYLLLSKAKDKDGGWHVGYVKKIRNYSSETKEYTYFIYSLDNPTVSWEIDPDTICACSGVVAPNMHGGDYLFTNDIISIKHGDKEYTGHVNFYRGCYGVTVPKPHGEYDFIPFYMFDASCTVKMIGNMLDEKIKSTKPTIICISGKARHGKDTFGEYLKDALFKTNASVLVTHYGDLLKYVAEKFWGWNGEKNSAGRSLLQEIGTDIVRDKYPEYWVKFVADMLEFSYGVWEYILIPDCRFENECGALFNKKLFDVITVRVERPDFDNGLTDEQKAHPSETSLDNFAFDYKFQCKTLDELRECAKTMADTLK